jgi:hypothetical protein
MNRPSSRSSPAPSFRRYLPLVALLLLVAAGATVAWVVLHGDGRTQLTSKPPEVATAPPESLPADPVPAVEAQDPPPKRGSEFDKEMEQLERTSFPGRKKNMDGSQESMKLAPLQGKVIDDLTHEPVYFFSVYLIPPENGEPLVAKETWAPSHFRNGEFTLANQPAGEYNLVVESREHEPVTRRISVPYEAGDLVVRLHHGNCVRGVIRDGYQTPLKDIEVNLVPVALDGNAPPPQKQLDKSDALGRYSFWKMPPGTYKLRVGVLGDWLQDVAEFRLEPGGEVLRDFLLEPLGTLKLTVKNIADQPVAKARVSLLRQLDDGRDRPVRTGYTDLKGIARLDFVREGSYKLRVNLQGFQQFEESVVIAANEGLREVPVKLEVAPRPGR